MKVANRRQRGKILGKGGEPVKKKTLSGGGGEKIR